MAFYFTTCYPSFHCSLFQLQSHIAKNEHLTPFKFIFLSKEACTELLLPEVCPLCSGSVRWQLPVAVWPTKGQPVWEQPLRCLLYSSCCGAARTAAWACCSFKVVWFMLHQSSSLSGSWRWSFIPSIFPFFLLSPPPSTLWVWNSLAAWKGENSSYQNILHKKVQRNIGWQRWVWLIDWGENMWLYWRGFTGAS